MKFTIIRSFLIPLISCMILLISIIISYILMKERQEDIFRTISAATAEQPQNGIYSICCFISAFIGLVVICLRYELVLLSLTNGNKLIVILNKLSLLFGALSVGALILVSSYPLSCSGENLTSNLQKKTKSPHPVLTLIFFAQGLVYCILQSIITCVQWNANNLTVKISRFCLTFFIVCAFPIGTAYVYVVYLVNIILYCMQAASHYYNMYCPLPNEAKQSSSALAVSQLCMSLCIILYILTFCQDLRPVRISITTGMKRRITNRYAVNFQDTFDMDNKINEDGIPEVHSS